MKCINLGESGGCRAAGRGQGHCLEVDAIVHSGLLPLPCPLFVLPPSLLFAVPDLLLLSKTGYSEIFTSTCFSQPLMTKSVASGPAAMTSAGQKCKASHVQTQNLQLAWSACNQCVHHCLRSPYLSLTSLMSSSPNFVFQYFYWIFIFVSEKSCYFSKMIFYNSLLSQIPILILWAECFSS